MELENVRLTGHFAFFTEEAVEALVSTSLDNIKAEIETGAAQNQRN